ncbi:MAG: GerMN domain-containing protein [Dermatophilaceae bacterium]
MSPPTVHRLRYALLAAVCVVLTGCASLASDQTIRPGLGVGRAEPDRNLQVAPPGPRSGGEPAEIVRGFIQALAGSGGDFVTARDFLTGAAVEEWSPEAQTVIFRGVAQIAEPTAEELAAAAAAEAEAAAASGDATAAPTATPAAPGEGEVAMRITASVWAEVARDGRYRELAAEEQRTTDLVLTLDDGEWRIRHLGEGFGRWVSTADFERLYDAYAVHYVSTGERLLIPDIRYVPTDRVATRLAQLQLGETPRYLLGAVRADIPSSARLAVGAVPVLGGVASVDLRGEGVGSDPTARANLWAQFVATLIQVREVERVEISLDGNPLEIPGIERVNSLSDLGFTAAATPSRVPPLIRQGATIGQATLRPQTADTLGEPTPAPPNEQGFPEIEPEWRDLALSFSGGELAGVSGEALSRWRDGIRYEVPRFATELGRPCYDRYDTLWVGGVGRVLARDRLFAINAAASPADPLRSPAQPLPVSWLDERRVISCHVSPQGTRIAIVSDTGEGTAGRLDIGTVIRQANGLPTGVVGPQTLGDQFATLTDAVWLTETSLGILGELRAAAVGDPVAPVSPTEPAPEPNGGEEEVPAPIPGPQPWLITVGGRTTELPDIEGAQRITSTGGERNLVITSADSDLVYVRAGSQWLPAQDRGSEVIVAAR